MVVPCYNEGENIKEFYLEVKKHLDDLFNELIFVDDGSQDNTMAEIKALAKTDLRVKFISFSRNFGHQSALRAGLAYCKGKCAVSLDADLQHPPALIPEMVKLWQSGYAIVYTLRQEDERITWFKKQTSHLFYKLINNLSGVRIEAGSADFRLLDRQVIDKINQLKEDVLFFRGIIPWMGYHQIALPYQANARFAGKSKYTLGKMFQFAALGITSFSVKPLRMAIFLGLGFSAMSIIYALYGVIIYFTSEDVISGWSSLLISILLIGGLQLIILGIIGEYLGKVFQQVKNRPNYLVQETNIKLHNESEG